MADAIQFLDVPKKLPQFKNSGSTVNFTRVVDRTFDILNSGCSQAKGYKQPLQPKSKDTWENHLKSEAEYLLSSAAKRKNKEKSFSLISREKHLLLVLLPQYNQQSIWFSLKENTFYYLLAYNFPQDT